MALRFLPIPLLLVFVAAAEQLEVSVISAAPALLPDAPTPALSPDITPLLPSPKGGGGGDGMSPSGSLPTIPSSPSPPNPDETVATGPASAGAPAGAFTTMAASSSLSAPPRSAGSRLLLAAAAAALFWVSLLPSLLL